MTASAALWGTDFYSEQIAAGYPSAAIWSMLTWVWPPPISGVLILYMALTVVMVPVFLIGGERYAFLTLGGSVIIWTISQFSTDITAVLTNHRYFNPFAWQLLFSIGLFFGIKWDAADPVPRPFARFTWLAWAAWAVVVVAFLYRLLLRLSYFGFDATGIRISDLTLTHMKANLSAVRLLHILRVVLLVATYFKPTNQILKRPILMPLIVSGMCSLELFSLTVVLSTLIVPARIGPAQSTL